MVYFDHRRCGSQDGLLKRGAKQYCTGGFPKGTNIWKAIAKFIEKKVSGGQQH